MAYKYISELPENVKKVLPKHAQEVYMKTFNDVWNKYSDAEKRLPGVSQEDASSKDAWDAVKHKYKRDQKGQWVERIK
jgi:cation transport regulator